MNKKRMCGYGQNIITIQNLYYYDQQSQIDAEKVEEMENQSKGNGAERIYGWVTALDKEQCKVKRSKKECQHLCQLKQGPLGQSNAAP